MQANRTYAKAHVLIDILDRHDRRPKPHLALVEAIRTEFADIPVIAEETNPYAMLETLKTVAPALLRGEVRPGNWSQHMKNYSACADAYMRLRAHVAQYEAAA